MDINFLNEMQNNECFYSIPSINAVDLQRIQKSLDTITGDKFW